MGHWLQVEGVCWPRLQAHSSPPPFLQTQSAANPRQSSSEGKSRREPSPGTQRLHPEQLQVLHRAHLPSQPLPILDETSLPPSASHMQSDRSIYCKEGEAPAWHLEKATGGKVPCVLHPLKSLPYPNARQLP